MSTIKLTGDYGFEVERSDDTGEVAFTLKVGDSTVTFPVGHNLTDAEELADAIDGLSVEARSLVTDWEDAPDSESDGIVQEDRGGYSVSLEGSHIGIWPRREIAVYELARAMTVAGIFPDTWYINERGNYDPIGAEVYGYIGDQDDLRPLPGVRYSEGDIVSLAGEDWPTWVVDADYEDLGVMVHTRGDATVTYVAEHSELTPYEDET